MNVIADPYGLQGNNQSLQGGYTGLQATGNPQQAASPQLVSNPYGPPAPTIATPRPVARPVIKSAAPVYHAPAPVQPQQLNPIFDPHIGTRASASNPGVLEYYNKQTGAGFSNPNELFGFASQLGAGNINSFDQLHAPIQSYAGGSYQGSAQGFQPADLNPNQQTAANAGTAGLTPAEYQGLVQGQNALTPEEIAAIRGGLGIDQLEQKVFQPPAQNTVDLYNTAYGAAGLASLKQQIQSAISSINNINSAYIDKNGNVNEDPFLSDASRTGRLANLETRRQAQLSNYTNELKNYQDLYSSGLNEVSGLVQRHTADFNQGQTLNAQKLQYLLSKAEQQGAATVAQKNQAAYQYLPDYLKAKAKGTAPTTFSAGNGASYYFDKNSGTFVQLTGANASAQVNPVTGDVFSGNTGQLIGGTGGSISIPQGTLAAKNNNPGNLRYVGQAGASAGAGGFARFNSPEEGLAAYQAQVQLDASRGLTLSQFISKYAPPSENNTSQYLQQAMAALGAGANTPLNQIDIGKLTQFQLQKESGTTFSGSASSTGVIDSTAHQLVDGTTNPSGISERTPGYLKILQRANEISMQQKGVPFNLGDAQINFDARKSGLNQNATTFRDIGIHQQTALNHLAELQSLANKAGFNNYPTYNDALIFKSDHVKSDVNIKNLQSTIGVIRGEVAAVLGGGTPTDSSRATAEQVLPLNVSPSQLSSVIANVKKLMQEKIDAISRTDNIPQFTSNNPTGSVQGGIQPGSSNANLPPLSSYNL